MSREGEVGGGYQGAEGAQGAQGHGRREAPGLENIQSRREEPGSERLDVGGRISVTMGSFAQPGVGAGGEVGVPVGGAAVRHL